MVRLVAALLALASLPATPAFAADSCAAIGPFPPTGSARHLRAVAGATQQPGARVREEFRLGDWRIDYLEFDRVDGAYLFFATPTATRPVTQWSGAARADEADDIASWAVQRAKGIPPQLAACFAKHVTSHDA
jgi:hypothetical protein